MQSPPFYLCMFSLFIFGNCSPTGTDDEYVLWKSNLYWISWKKNLSISSDFEYYLSSDENESWDLLLILLPCLFSKFYIKLVMKVIKLKIMSKWSKKCMLVLVWYNFHFCISTGRTMIRRKFRRMLFDQFTGVCFLSHPCYYHFKAMTTIHSKKKLFHHFLGLSILRISILSSEADASDE